MSPEDILAWIEELEGAGADRNELRRAEEQYRQALLFEEWAMQQISDEEWMEQLGDNF